MANYFRITAFNENENISIIMDSNGRFEKLWQFSAMLVEKGFKILEVGSSEKFLDGNITKADEDLTHFILRASEYGKPEYTEYSYNGQTYKAVKVQNKTYIPDKDALL